MDQVVTQNALSDHERHDQRRVPRPLSVIVVSPAGDATSLTSSASEATARGPWLSTRPSGAMTDVRYWAVCPTREREGRVGALAPCVDGANKVHSVRQQAVDAIPLPAWPPGLGWLL